MGTTTVDEAPSTQEQFEAVLKDRDQVGKLLSEGRFTDFVNGYADKRAKADNTLLDQVQEETQRVLTQWLKDNRVANTRRVNLDPTDGVKSMQAQKNRLYNSKAPGASIDKDYNGSAEFMQSIWHHANTLSNGAELQAKTHEWRKIQNSFGSTVPADGGFLIPETLRSELLQVALESAVVRPRARVIPMESLRVPIPMVDSTSNVSSVFGGIVAYWTEEGASLTESQASFGRVVLEAKKLTAYCEVPNELVADAPAFGAFLDQILPEAIAYYEDYAFIAGSGVGEPLGFLNGSGLVSVTETASNLIGWDDVIKMYARMLPQSLNRAVWIASIDTFPQLAKMTVSGATIPLWLTGGQGIQAPPMTLLGRPIIFTEKVPALGTTGALNFVDFGFYLIGDRQVMQAMSSPHFKFASDKTAYRIIERVDGRPWLNTAITPKNGSATLSPYVTLLSA